MKTETTQLTEREVEEIEARANVATDPYSQGAQSYIDTLVSLVRADVPALIRDWRALTARVMELERDYNELVKEANRAEETMLRKLYGR